MQTPQFSDFLFTSASLLNGASGQVANSVEDITGSLFSPGIANAASISIVPSALNINVTFTGKARIIFGSGVMAGGYGLINGAINGAYVVNMASLIPGSGSVTAYVVASAAQIGQQSVLITGPSPGHPDYDPNYIPYTAYLQTLDTVAVTGTLTVPDNVVYIELCRVTLTSGETTIPSVNTAFQVTASPANVNGLTVTDGSHTISNTATISVSGAVVGGSGGDATLTISDGIKVTDGTHTINNATTLSVAGATIGGTSPDATFTIPVGIEITDGTHTINNATTISVSGGAVVGGTSPDATLSISATPPISHQTISGTTSLTLTTPYTVLLMSGDSNVTVPTPSSAYTGYKVVFNSLASVNVIYILAATACIITGDYNTGSYAPTTSYLIANGYPSFAEYWCDGTYWICTALVIGNSTFAPNNTGA